MNDTLNIPNLSIFEVNACQIHLFKDEDSDMYRSAVFFNLDDGSDIDDYGATIMTHLTGEDAESLSKISFLYASTLFPSISPVIKVWNEIMTEFTEIDLRTKRIAPDSYAIH